MDKKQKEQMIIIGEEELRLIDGGDGNCSSVWNIYEQIVHGIQNILGS